MLYIHKCKNQIGCIGMIQCTKLLKQEATIQQSSATHSLQLSFLGLQNIVVCCQSSSQCLLVFSINDFYTCVTIA